MLSRSIERVVSSVAVFALAFVAASQSGCNSDSRRHSAALVPTNNTSINGSVNKGPVDASEVRVYELSSDGSRGDLVGGPYASDATGTFTGILEREAGQFLVMAQQGSYVDESTGADVVLDADHEFESILDLSRSASTAATPLTKSMLTAARRTTRDGMSLDQAIDATLERYQTAFGFDPTTASPSLDAAATTGQKQYAAILGGFSRLVDREPALAIFSGSHPYEVVDALALDVADGRLNGLLEPGTVIEVARPRDDGAPGEEMVPLPALSQNGLAALMAAAADYASEVPELEGITLPDDVDVTPEGQGPGPVEGFFSGEGASTLPSTDFQPTLFTISGDGEQTFLDEQTGIDLRILPGFIDPTRASRVSVWVDDELRFQALNALGILGVTVSDEGAVFDMALLQPQSEQEGSEPAMLILNGTITRPETPAMPPAAPTGLLATSLEENIGLAWDLVEGVDSYVVYAAEETGIAPSNWESLTGGSRFETLATGFQFPTSLIAGQPYYMVVTAINAVGEGEASDEVVAVPQERTDGGPDAGTVTFSGPGAGALMDTIFQPTTIGDGALIVWSDGPNDVRIEVGPTANLIRVRTPTDIFISEGDGPGSIEGLNVTRGAVQFDNVTIPGDSELVLTGSLLRTTVCNPGGALSLTGPAAETVGSSLTANRCELLTGQPIWYDDGRGYSISVAPSEQSSSGVTAITIRQIGTQNIWFVVVNPINNVPGVVHLGNRVTFTNVRLRSPFTAQALFLDGTMTY